MTRNSEVILLQTWRGQPMKLEEFDSKEWYVLNLLITLLYFNKYPKFSSHLF